MTQTTHADDATTGAIAVRAAPPRHRPGAAWAAWVLRRVLLALLTLWLCSLVVFLSTAALGDPVRAVLGKDYGTSPERVAALRAQMHLDEPVITRYFTWLGHLLTGDPGVSVASGQPVGELVGDRILNSAVLVIIAAVLMVPVAIGVAMAFAVSWKPFVKSKNSARTMTSTTTKMISTQRPWA